MSKKILFTSESVGPGHPDKICDQISDAILDECLKQDKNSRVACEVMASNRLIIIGGEITTKGYVDVIKIAWEILSKLGYNETDFTIASNINKQSIDISHGVNKKNGEIGAGDQGIMFGFATNETKEFMPLPIVLAHEIVKLAEKLRIQKKFKWAQPDMKSQVTIDYTNMNEIHIDTILFSVQHLPNFNKKQFENFIKKEIIYKVAKKFNMNLDFKIYINPAGNFIIGGPIGDTGLTGRKIIVDTYGGFSRHGGGAFSGKDYTKVDRSAAYAARWIAKNIVVAKIASIFEIQLSYGIGMLKPISININTFGTSKKYTDFQIINAIKKTFDLSPTGIIKSLNLKNQIYLPLSTFGHFGRMDLDLPWERANMVKIIKNNLKLK